MLYRLTLFSSAIGEWIEEVHVKGDLDDYLADYLSEHPVFQDSGSRVKLSKAEKLVEVWENPQDGYWETDDSIFPFKTFKVTERELRDHNERVSEEIRLMFAEGGPY